MTYREEINDGGSGRRCAGNGGGRRRRVGANGVGHVGNPRVESELSGRKRKRWCKGEEE